MENYGIFVVCIEQLKEKSVRGWFMNPYIEHYIKFCDLGEMILKMDTVLQKLIKEEEKTGMANMQCYHPLQTFKASTRPEFFYVIQVLYMCCGTWQGIITGINRPRTPYKSTLDCIQKMDHAMRESKIKKK